MATITISAGVGNALNAMMTAADIVPGDAPSYELCKKIYTYHPLGKKLVDKPIQIAQSQRRTISIPGSPEERVREAFETEWDKVRADEHIANIKRISRMYGIGSGAIMIKGEDPSKPLDFKALAGKDISFNSFDPLNTSGSLVLNQIPTDIEFQHVTNISALGQKFHRSRTVTVLNGPSIYIDWTTSAYGFVGRSVYQSGLYPLKTFIQSMITDHLVMTKAGVIVAKMKQQGSIQDRIAGALFAAKRDVVKEAQVGNVISIGDTEGIESIDLKNLEGPVTMSRKNILENIASSGDMPAILLTQESFANGFGEGTEDANQVVQYIKSFREEIRPLYAFFDEIVMYRAWNREFYETIQQLFPEEYGEKSYDVAFNQWRNNFRAIWPSLKEEPESEKIKVPDAKLKAMIAFMQVLLPEMDPDNKATVIRWVADNVNQLKDLFPDPIELDYDALASYVPPSPLEEPKPDAPFSAHDSVGNKLMSIVRNNE